MYLILFLTSLSSRKFGKLVILCQFLRERIHLIQVIIKELQLQVGLGKLFTLILNERSVTFLDERKILKPNQVGFRKGNRTTDRVSVMNSMINSYTRKGKKFMPASLTSPKHMILFGEMGCYTN